MEAEFYIVDIVVDIVDLVVYYYVIASHRSFVRNNAEYLDISIMHIFICMLIISKKTYVSSE